MWECQQQLRTDGSPVHGKQDKVETEAARQRARTEGINENSNFFHSARRPELITGLGLQLLPQVYGLLYAPPSSTICVSWATDDCLQAPPARPACNHLKSRHTTGIQATAHCGITNGWYFFIISWFLISHLFFCLLFILSPENLYVWFNTFYF